MTLLRTFNDVENDYVRAYNRVITATNLKTAGQNAAAEDYLRQFDDVSKEQMFLVILDIQLHGYENIKKKVSESIYATLPEEEEEINELT